MKQFLSVNDVDNPELLAKEALVSKYNPHADKHLGRNKSICLIFLNSSLRTRLSTTAAAKNLGLEVSIFNADSDGWQLEYEDGIVMDQGKAEHVKEAAAVIGSYFDIIGIRAFPGLQDRDADYAEKVHSQFAKYCGKPLVSLESASLHPLQSLTDLITIRENAGNRRPKVVLSWAPHPRALPQAVANSFAEWMNRADVDLTITHPRGFELDKKYTGNASIVHDQSKAYEGADFIYAKNWSSYQDYGKIGDFPDWMITEKKLQNTNEAKFMHCLPVRRNVVVEDAVLDGPRSLVIEQAANRLPAAQVVLKRILTR